MVELKHSYIQVQKDGKKSYGGNQAWGLDSTMKKYGCGAIAGADLILYLKRTNTGSIEEKLSGFCEEYEAQIFSGSAGSWNAWVDAGFRT